MNQDMQTDRPQLFIELFNYKPEWKALAVAERQAFADRLAVGVEKMPQLGIEVIAWGVNDRRTDRRAPYDFFCVYRLVSVDALRRFEAGIASSDWYRYFDQVAVSGDAGSPHMMMEVCVALGEP
ncbi:DUF6616 family protein [Burkholderia pyrrocinia]|uniref:DUF6616 family protein n=1 Tax=Burkholderia pyrrocinia TaxID=60550 RepID=UPI002AB23EE4|nr:DUF6616 family protein [Burkholderia pyrrocinia]